MSVQNSIAIHLIAVKIFQSKPKWADHWRSVLWTLPHCMMERLFGRPNNSAQLILKLSQQQNHQQHHPDSEWLAAANASEPAILKHLDTEIAIGIPRSAWGSSPPGNGFGWGHTRSQANQHTFYCTIETPAPFLQAPREIKTCAEITCRGETRVTVRSA